MANGNNHAKQILIKEARALADKLQNGSAGDMETIGRTVGLLTAITTDMYENDFRTVQDCDKYRKSQKHNINSKPMKLKFGPLMWEGHVTPAILMTIPSVVCCGLCVFIVGKNLNWW